MLSFGRIRLRNCQRVHRRALLEAGSLAALGLSLADLLRIEANAAPTNAPSHAKSVILLWLWGGPSHLDTFDLKPQAPTEYRGPYAPISTAVPGIQICELLPRLADRAAKYAILRSLNHNNNDHGIAGTIGLTGAVSGAISLGGQTLPGQVKPAHGSVLARVLGPGSTIPSFVSLGGYLHQGKRRIAGEGGGLVGSLYDPFRLDYEPEHGVQLPQLELLAGQTTDSLATRRNLRAALDELARSAERSGDIARLDQFYRQAFSLLTSGDARKVFDLDSEPAPLRDRYGRFRFGQCCLLARRLIETGVRFVQVNWSSHVEPVEDTGDGGWDLHDRNFAQMHDRHAWMLDQAASTLLDDLEERGLLHETVVVAIGEFGRTPKINNKAGRDHWNQCYSAIVGGGGIRGGQVIGASDPRGEFPRVRPLRPCDLFTTVLDRLGIGTTRLTSVGLTPLGEVIPELT